LTLRALEVMRSVDLIAAEDTRVTQKLLQHHRIRTKLMAVHEHNEHRSAERIVALLREGKTVALVTDAGTPGISDPGAQVVAAARAAGFAVSPIPGASAAIAALSAAGRTVDRFLFCGFLPPRPAARRTDLERLRGLPFLLVFYEAPHRVLETLADLREVLGAQREVTVARELTKQFECFHTCLLGEAEQWVAADANRERGEFVLLVGGAATVPDAQAANGEHALRVLLGELPLKQAVALAAAVSGARRNSLYQLALSLKGGTP
jgi:16S rRNA (cytidine1402-2'-O)-methyltransferase